MERPQNRICRADRVINDFSFLFRLFWRNFFLPKNILLSKRVHTFVCRPKIENKSFFCKRKKFFGKHSKITFVSFFLLLWCFINLTIEPLGPSVWNNLLNLVLGASCTYCFDVVQCYPTRAPRAKSAGVNPIKPILA